MMFGLLVTIMFLGSAAAIYAFFVTQTQSVFFPTMPELWTYVLVPTFLALSIGAVTLESHEPTAHYVAIVLARSWTHLTLSSGVLGLTTFSMNIFPDDGSHDWFTPILAAVVWVLMVITIFSVLCALTPGLVP